MPIFEFSCSKCDRDFELLVRSAQWEGKAECPHCGSRKLAKKLSVFASSVAPSTNAGVPAACPMKRGGGHGGGCGCCP